MGAKTARINSWQLSVATLARRIREFAFEGERGKKQTMNRNDSTTRHHLETGFQELQHLLDREPTDSELGRILSKSDISLRDFCAFLSPKAEKYLEPMAQRAAELTRRHFGHIIFLFTPLYISNYCENRCPYCSFAAQHRIRRKKLSPSEVAKEAERLSEEGIRHILVLTGEARKATPFAYLEESIEIIAQRFSAVGIEVFPMTENEYGRLIDRGVDSLTIYQEVYDRPTFERLHAGGPKADYDFRLEAPVRAARANIRSLTIGALYGLFDFRREALYTALHAEHLLERHPDVELSLSFPRLRPFEAAFDPPAPVGDRQLVQLMTAFRMLYPHVGITISTRENREFRNGALPLGPTKMSAGVSTAVGGHCAESTEAQFEIADGRSVAQLSRDLLARGFQPVTHDWDFRLMSK